MESLQTSAGPVNYGKGYEPVPAELSAAVTSQPSSSFYTTTAYVERPPNQLVLAFITLCLCSCCWPALVFAIMGIVYSVQVDSQWTNKDYAGAKKSSTCAKRWSIAAIVAGVVVLAIYILILVLQVVHGASSSDEHQDNE